MGNHNPGTFSDAETVSVVVPSHNHGRFIGRCLRSVINQSHTPLELIVIDDGSNDGSPKLIEAELKNCPFQSELISHSRRGIAQTLNEGLRQSRGKYFAYLGSDDVWLPGFLASRVRVLKSRPSAVLAYGHSFVINEGDQIIECTSQWAPYRDGWVREMLLYHVVPFSPSVLYRREALERHGWNEDSALEDYDLYLRLCVDGEFAFDEAVLCAWRSHQNNKSRDLDFVLAECVKAQSHAASVLNLSPDELAKARSRLKWRCATDFVRTGEKRKALKLACSNLRGATSLASVGRMVVSLSLPMPVLRWRRQLVERQAMKAYGSLF